MGCYQPLVTKIPPYMVQNLYSERELSIKLCIVGRKNSKTKLTYDHFRPTHTYIKLTLLLYFSLICLICTIPIIYLINVNLLLQMIVGAENIFWQMPELVEGLLVYLSPESTLCLAQAHLLTRKILQGSLAWNKLIKRSYPIDQLYKVTPLVDILKQG